MFIEGNAIGHFINTSESTKACTIQCSKKKKCCKKFKKKGKQQCKKCPKILA